MKAKTANKLSSEVHTRAVRMVRDDDIRAAEAAGFASNCRMGLS